MLLSLMPADDKGAASRARQKYAIMPYQHHNQNTIIRPPPVIAFEMMRRFATVYLIMMREERQPPRDGISTKCARPYLTPIYLRRQHEY